MKVYNSFEELREKKRSETKPQVPLGVPASVYRPLPDPFLVDNLNDRR